MDNEKETGVINSVMAVNTMDRGKMDDTVATELALGKTDDVIEVNGAMEWLTGRALKPMQTEPYGTMANG